MLGRPHHIFSVVAIFIGMVLWGAIYFSTDWHPYVVWLIAWGGNDIHHTSSTFGP
jgi:hypothetical protein